MAKFIEKGLVLSTKDKKAKVKLITPTDCGNKGCPLTNLCGKQDLIVETENPINAKEGDRVKIKIESAHYYKALFLVFILPIILLISGYLLGIKMAGKETAGYIFMGLGIIIWFFVLRFSSKFYKAKYKVIEVLNIN
jgi:sigma-E factor negative regulatory protein RseC